ncbi:MAG: phosphatidylinositol kinase, partial [Actinomycetota bacterium]
TERGHLWGVDHGVSFNLERKLRTVLWGFAGEPLPPDATDVLRALRSDLADTAADGLGAGLAALLSRAEVRRTVDRVHALIGAGRFPRPSAHGPAIPWPPW